MPRHAPGVPSLSSLPAGVQAGDRRRPTRPAERGPRDEAAGAGAEPRRRRKRALAVTCRQASRRRRQASSAGDVRRRRRPFGLRQFDPRPIGETAWKAAGLSAELEKDSNLPPSGYQPDALPTEPSNGEACGNRTRHLRGEPRRSAAEPRPRSRSRRSAVRRNGRAACAGGVQELQPLRSRRFTTGSAPIRGPLPLRKQELSSERRNTDVRTRGGTGGRHRSPHSRALSRSFWA